MPVEFGALNLFRQTRCSNTEGLFGQMIIEPAGSTWTCGEGTAAADQRPCDPVPNTPARPHERQRQLPFRTVSRTVNSR